MNVSLTWLKTYVDLDRPVSEIAHILTMAGVEVAETREIGANWDKVYVGRVSALEKHPNADRLLLATVDYGAEPITVVTGAPNLAVGDLVPLALVGATLQDPYADQPRTMKVKPAKLRGVRSEGMVCSAKELGLGDDHLHRVGGCAEEPDNFLAVLDTGQDIDREPVLENNHKAVTGA